MKVLQVINSLNTGGAEKLLVETIPLYKKKGIAIDLLLLNGTTTIFLKELKATHCCNIYSLGGGSVYNPLLILKIIPFLKKYTIIHVHLFPALYWVSLAKMIGFSKTKLVYTEHNTTNNRRKNTIYKLLDRYVYKSYSKIITIAKEVDTNLKKHLNINLDRYQLINNGVNTKVYNTAKAYLKTDFFSTEDILLIQVSSFRFQKDQVTLIRSLTLLPKNVKLLLVGDGELRKDCEIEVANLRLEKRVKFLGNRIDVPRLLKTADIVVLASHHEGLSLASIEGMASGKPFVASNVPGLGNVVRDAGLLFEEANENDLSKHILDLISDKAYYNTVVKTCIKRANQFDIQKMVDSYAALYKELV